MAELNIGLFPVIMGLLFAILMFARSIHSNSRKAFVRKVQLAAASSLEEEAVLEALDCAKRTSVLSMQAVGFLMWAAYLLALFLRHSSLIEFSKAQAERLDLLAFAIFVIMAILAVSLYRHPANTQGSFS
jgi:hypothetical protein